MIRQLRVGSLVLLVAWAGTVATGEEKARATDGPATSASVHDTPVLHGAATHTEETAAVDRIHRMLQEVRRQRLEGRDREAVLSALDMAIARLREAAPKAVRPHLDQLDSELRAVREVPVDLSVNPYQAETPSFATLNHRNTSLGSIDLDTAQEPPRKRVDRPFWSVSPRENRAYQQIGLPGESLANSNAQPGNGVILMAQATAGAAESQGNQNNVDPMDQLVILDFKEMELSAVVQLLAQKAQINVIAGTEVQGVVTANLRNIPLRKAIETVLRMQGLGIIEEDGIYRIVPYEEAVAARRKQRLVYLDNAQANEVQRTLQDVIQSSPDAPLLSVAANDSTNVVIISGPEDLVDDLHDLALKLDVAEPSLPTVTRAIKLNYAEPVEILPVVDTLLTDQVGEASVDNRSRHIIVTDLPVVVEEIVRLIEDIDLPVKQVSIDVMIVDALMSDNAETGIDWILDSVRRTNQRGQVVGDLQNATFETDITGGSPTPGALSSIPQAGNLAFRILSSDIDFRAVVAAQVQNDNAELIANPVVVTVENKLARISIAEELPFQELTQSTTGPPISTTEFKEVGTVLEVMPRVTHDNHIIVDIDAKQSDTKGESITGVPPEDKREAESTLRVKDGQTIFIGGLRRHDDEKTARKVPVLGDVPILSFLFKRSSVVNEIVELLLFVTCNVLGEDAPDLTPYQQEVFDRLGGKPEVPNAERKMWDQFVDTDEMRDPIWKWRRTK